MSVTPFPRVFSFLAIFHVLSCMFFIFLLCQFSRHVPGHAVCISQFSPYSVFLAIFQVIHCVSFSTFFSFFFKMQVPQSLFIILHVFQCFLQNSRSYSVCVSHFARFSGFLAIFHILPCDFLIFLFCKFSSHIPDPTKRVSHFPCWSDFSPYSSSCSVHFSFTRFQCFSPYSRSNSVYFSFFTFSIFLAILHVLQFAFHIYHVLQCLLHISGPKVCVSHFRRVSVSCHTPGPTVCISHFSCFSVFLAILQAIQYLCLIFQAFQFSCHNTGPTLCISHISRFSLLLATFQVLECVFLILHVLNISLRILPLTVCVSHFLHFSVFLPFSRSYSVHFSFFHVFQCFSLYSRSSQVIYSFSILVRFLAILLVLQGALLIFDIFQ